MKKALIAVLSACGIHKHLSAEQKSDLATAGAQATPGALSTGAMKFYGVGLADMVAFATLIFIILQVAHLVWKWRRQSRLDREARERGDVPLSTGQGRL